MTSSNRKVVFTALGDISNIKILTTEIAAPAQGEAQVDIMYAGFAGADINMLHGNYPMQPKAPLTPGYCFTGRVAANGPGASEFKVGDLVTAVTVYDSDAEKINIPEKYLVAVPDGVDPKISTALCLDWNTAYGMVKRSAKVKPGQRVFVHGLSGAVGHALMVLAKMEGATVYGTASARHHDALRAEGAHPFVYTDKSWIDEMKKLGGAHAVFDPLGFESFDESYSILSDKEPSIVIAYGNNKAALEGDHKRSPWLPVAKLLARNLVPFSSKSTTFYGISRDAKTFKPELRHLLGLAQEGSIEVPIRRVWDMDDVVDAHQAWGKVAGMGSLLIRVRDE